jgi:hypothetical protein
MPSINKRRKTPSRIEEGVSWRLSSWYLKDLGMGPKELVKKGLKL